MKIIKTLTLLVILSLIHLTIYAEERNAIIKVNVLRGESLVTSNVNIQSAESLVHDELKRMGINRVYSQKGINADLLFIEAFVYQFPADNPTLVLTVRNINSTISLSDKQKSRVKSAIEAIPIWCTKEETYEADLILKIL